MRYLATVTDKSGLEARLAGSFVSGYSGISSEIKFSDRHRAFKFNGVLFKL